MSQSVARVKVWVSMLDSPGIDSIDFMKDASGAKAVSPHAPNCSADSAMMTYSRCSNNVAIMLIHLIGVGVVSSSRCDYLEIKASAADNTLYGLETREGLDSRQDCLKSFLCGHERRFVLVGRPLHSPLPANFGCMIS
jgi:hypothetical protein